jgi:hypothetical protein
MSTTIVESWAGADLSQLGPIYPMVGTEVILFVLGVAFWLGFHILQAGIEKREFEADRQAAKSKERVARVFEDEAHSGY